MNDYKIQLESKEDLVFLKQEFANFIDSNVDSASTVSDNLRQQVSSSFGANFVSLMFFYDFSAGVKFIERVFSIVTENVQINGVDWAEATQKNSAMEAVNNDLVTRLQEMQAETESLMQKVIKHRREAPVAAKKAFIAQNEAFLAHLKQEQTKPVELSAEDLDLCSFDTSITPNFYVNKFSSGLSNLVHLQNVRFLVDL